MARRRLIAFALLGIVAYALAMVATLPASVVFKNRAWRTGVAGTIWNGEVGVAGGSTVEWRWSPLRSLTSLGFAADWKATGPDTDLGGRVLAGFSSTVLDNVSGSADASLLQAVGANLPFACNVTMQVAIDRLVLGGPGQMAQGRVATDPGTCNARGGLPTPVAPLLIIAEKIGAETRIRVTPLTQRRRVLVDASLGESGQYDMRVTPEGAAALPFLGATPGVRIQGEM